MARWRADGTIEFLGRLDFQVKVRGFRIELGEIESVLSRHSAVKQAVVSVREDKPGDKRIVAYVVPSAVQTPSAPDLRSFLSRSIPDYMVPSAFVMLERLPLTPNRKVDRKALPAPNVNDQENADNFVAPHDMLEQQLTQIWEKVLGVYPISVRANFFELGGHSLLAVRLFARVEKLTGKHLPLVTLFQAPTIEQLAGILRDTGWAPTWTSLVTIQPSGCKPPLYVVHGVGGNILEFMELAKCIDSDQPFYGLQAQGLDGQCPRHTSVEEMAAHYLKEIRDFQPEGPYYLAGSSFGGMIAFEMARQLHAVGEELGLLVFFDTVAPSYPQYLPTTTAFRRWLNEQWFRFDLHWSSFKTATGREKSDYVRTKLSRLKKQFKQWRRKAVQECYQRVRDKIQRVFLPQAIRAVQESGAQATRSYQPKPYAGKVTLFRAATQPPGIYEDPANGWKDYALGGIDIHTIPGHHGSISRMPRVRILAQRLRECLAQAHESARRKRNPVGNSKLAKDISPGLRS